MENVIPNNRNEQEYVLLTGGTGFLGSFLSRELLKRGYRVIFLTRKNEDQDARTRVEKQLKFINTPSHLFNNIEVVEGDITKPLDEILALIKRGYNKKIKEIWHLAGLVNFQSKNLPFINIEGTKNVLDLAKKLGCHINHISTIYVIGKSNNSLIKEEEIIKKPAFNNPYEQSKYEGERMVLDYTKHGWVTSTIYRPAILIGDSEMGTAFTFTGYYVPLMFFYNLKKYSTFHPWLSKLPIIIPYVHKAKLNIIPIDEAARLIINIDLNENSRNGKIFHITHPNPPTVKFVFEQSLKKLGFQNVYMFKVPNLFMKALKIFLNLSSFINYKNGKKLRRYLGDYFTYFTDSRVFSNEHVRELLNTDANVIPVDKNILDKCITYAIENKFST